MFSRDSQLSSHSHKRHSSSSQDRLAQRSETHPGKTHPRQAHDSKAVHNRNMSVESPSETLGKKAGEALGEKLRPEIVAELAAEKERSHSWQVAPNLFTSFRYAWAGISYAFRTQRNFRVHTGVGTIAMSLCWALHVSNIEIAIICLTIGAVLVMEILNTALESLVDLTVGQTYHDLAKVAKDCAAGAVLMAAIVAILVAALIFVPPLWTNLQNHVV